MTWNKVTDSAPPVDRDLLVWTGSYMFVSDATFFDGEHIKAIKEMGMGEDYIARTLKSKGYFQEFGTKIYFDDPKVYWAELPLPPRKERA